MANAICSIFTVTLASFLSLFFDNVLCKTNDAMRFKESNMLLNNYEENKMNNNKRDIYQHVKKRETLCQYHFNRRDLDTVNNLPLLHF